MSASNGWASVSTEAISRIITNIRNGLDKACEVPLDSLLAGDVKAKQSPAIFSLALQTTMLETLEAEMFSRGIDPRTIPGTDWTEILMNQESN